MLYASIFIFLGEPVNLKDHFDYVLSIFVHKRVGENRSLVESRQRRIEAWKERRNQLTKANRNGGMRSGHDADEGMECSGVNHDGGMEGRGNNDGGIEGSGNDDRGMEGRGNDDGGMEGRGNDDGGMEGRGNNDGGRGNDGGSEDERGILTGTRNVGTQAEFGSPCVVQHMKLQNFLSLTTNCPCT